MGVSLESVTPGAEDLSSESEGEIIDVDAYEDISSDEEFNLRQRIEELETRNSELEKIASISSTKASGYEYIDLVDEDSSPAYDEYADQRSRRVFRPERSSCTRRKKERTGRVEAHHHRHSQARCKHGYRKRDRFSKKSSSTRHSNRSGKICRRRASFAEISRSRSPAVEFSSDTDEDTQYRPDRNELQAALRRDVSVSKLDVSSLKRKLKGVQKCVTEFIAAKVEHDVEESELNASLEIMELLDTLTDQNIIDGIQRKKSEVEEEKTPIPHVVPIANSLEEQELRLAALKSAILKKHEARKKRRVIEERPYSPTDTDITLDTHDPLHKAEERKGGHDNMDISPAVSPEHTDKTLLSVDMDLASDDDSGSQNFPFEQNHIPSQFIEMSNQWNPLPPNGISNFTMFQTNKLPPPPPPPAVTPYSSKQEDVADLAIEDEEEMALRALLLSTKPKKKNTVIVPPSPAVVEGSNAIESVDMDLGECDTDNLRILVLQSIPKTMHVPKENATASLKRAVQRLNGLHQTTNPKHVPSMSIIKHQVQPLTQTDAECEGSDRNKENTTTEPYVQSTPSNTSDTASLSVSNIPHKQIPKPVVAKRKLINNNNHVSINSTKPSHSMNYDPAIKKQRCKTLITNPVARQIKPFIIRLAPGGSSSSEDSDDADQCPSTNHATPFDQYFDPSSPASVAMDSPGYAPSSPRNDMDQGDSNSSASNLNPERNLENSVFEQKLDEYLRSVRIKNELQTPTASQPNTPIMLKLKPTSRVTPSAVRHLPLSSQIEYRQLIQRMNSLEKQKVAQTAVSPSIPKPPLSGATRPDSLVKQVLVKTASANSAKALALKPATIQTAIVCETHTKPPRLPQPPKDTLLVIESFHKISSIKSVSETARRDELLKTEEELRQYSTGFLSQVNGIHELVQTAQQVRHKQHALERQRDRLRQQLQLIDRKLSIEKTALRQLLPSITQGHRSIRAFRERSTEIRGRCKELGTELVGIEYRSPSDDMNLVEKRIRVVIEETQKLKTMKNSVPNPLVHANVINSVIQTANQSANATVIIPKQETASASTNIVVSIIPEIDNNEDECIKRVQQNTTNTNSNEAETDPHSGTHAIQQTPASISVIELKNQEETLIVTSENTIQCQTVDQSSDRATHICSATDRPEAHPAGQDAATTSSILKYQSPLDSMQPMQISSEAINPDAVLCPYELQGCCDDLECMFQHLSDRK